MYYVYPGDSEFARLGLNYTVEGETNLIGVHVEGDYSRATGDMYAIMGMTLWAEYLDGIAIVTVGSGTEASQTAEPTPQGDKPAPQDGEPAPAKAAAKSK